MRLLPAAALALSILASPVLAAAEDEVDGHEWLQEHSAHIRGRVITLALVRDCHARSVKWSDRMESALGRWVGENTVRENQPESMRIVVDATSFYLESWSAVGRPLCRMVDPRILDALERQLTDEE